MLLWMSGINIVGLLSMEQRTTPATDAPKWVCFEHIARQN